jgi:hypothetical protein
MQNGLSTKGYQQIANNDFPKKFLHLIPLGTGQQTGDE